MNVPSKLTESYILSNELIQKHESRHWKKLNQPKRDVFFNSLNKNFSQIEKFRSDKLLSKGLDDAVEKKFIPEVFFKLLENHDWKKVLDYMQDRNIGESNHSINIFDKFVDYNELFLIDFACKLQEYALDSLSEPIICEIGGGYGALARMISSHNKCKYILIDLPEANLISSYYLDQHFASHGKKILYFCDLNKDNISYEDIHDFDFIVLPPNVRFLDNLKVDLFINTRSMMEMQSGTINEYFKLIQSNIDEKGYFLNINRYIKRTVGENIMISRYPYDKNWRVKVSEKSFLQDHIHFLLTQRDFSDNNEIFEELSRLEDEAKNYFESNFSIYSRKFLNVLKSIIPSGIKNKIKITVGTH